MINTLNVRVLSDIIDRDDCEVFSRESWMGFIEDYYEGLLENTCRANQVIVRGNPSIWSEIGTWRHMIRAAAWSNTHVVALIYNDTERRFLLYDNDSEERKNGQPGVKTEQELRGYEFEGLVAVTEKGSALERQSKEHRREVYEELDDSEDSERIDETWRRFVGD